MPRFFIDSRALEGKIVKITGANYNHIHNALRLKKGDEISLSCGDGWDYLVSLKDFKKDFVIGEIQEKIENETEPDLCITIAQAIPKKNNMELVVQKTTELGVYSIIPLETSRTIVQISDKRKKKRLGRWQKIAEEAAKQSKRGIIPEVKDIHTLEDIKLLSDRFDLILIPWEEEKTKSLHQVLKDYKASPVYSRINNILVIIGPEGGFTVKEMEFVNGFGGVPVSLGSRILRTETARLVTLSVLFYETGEMGVV